MRKTLQRLVSIHLVERREEDLDELGHFVWHWTYPTIEGFVRSFIEKRLHSRTFQSMLSSEANKQVADRFDFYRVNSRWVYVLSGDVPRHVFVLLTSDFCPHTYQSLLAIFGQMFQRALPTGRLLHYYLTLLIKGHLEVYELSNVRFSLSSSDTRADALHPTSRGNLKEIIRLFHLDVILIYTALLLKRKIAIYHHSQSTLLDFMSALPAFVSHRTECYDEILFPNVDLHSEEQIKGLEERTHYIATFQDSKVEEREDLYDIYVNLAAVEITIAHKSREVFCMTKTHKDVAITLVRVAENDSATNEDIIYEITKKTTDLRNWLLSIANEQTDSSSPGKVAKLISKDKLKQKLLSPNLESFYWNLAVAEGIAVIED